MRASVKLMKHCGFSVVIRGVSATPSAATQPSVLTILLNCCAPLKLVFWERHTEKQ